MLNSDSLIERGYLRKKLTFWRTVAILIFVALLLKLFSGQGVGGASPLNKFSPNYIARISITEVIDHDSDREGILHDLANDPSVSAVILYINSPGGSAVGGETLYKSLKELNAKKPVVTVMGSLATSAAYLAPLGTSRIYAHNGTITGSIGVIMQMPNVKELTDKMGIKFDFIKTAPLKGSPSPFEASSPEALAVLNRIVQDFYTYFVNVVAEERKLDVAEVRKIADGRVVSGLEAKGLKLIDEIGGEPEAASWLIENNSLPKDIKVKEYSLKKPDTPFAKLMQTAVFLKELGARLTDSLKISGLSSIWR
jgi:protease-4